MRVKYKTLRDRAQTHERERKRTLAEIEAGLVVSPLFGLLVGIIALTWGDLDAIELPPREDARCPDADGRLCFACADRRRKFSYFHKVVH